MCDKQHFLSKTLFLPSSIIRGKGDCIEEYSWCEARSIYHQPGEARFAEDLYQEHASPPPRHKCGACRTNCHQETARKANDTEQ